MKFLCSCIHINSKKIIKKKILDKVIFIESLLICYKQILYLKCSKLSNHIYIITCSSCHDYIFKIAIIFNLKKLKTINCLTFCWRINKTNRIRKAF